MKRRNSSVFLVTVLLATLLLGCQGEQVNEQAEEDKDATPILAYAEGVTVVEDPDALQKAVDKMFEDASKPGVSLEYKDYAASSDGLNFSCYIANSLENKYDMYINIYADAALTEQIYLSGLVRPGSAFDNITLEKTLAPGKHTVYVAFTQVEEDLKTIHAQVVHTMTFDVTK